MKKSLALAGLLAALAFAQTANAAQPSLHVYQTGRQVKGLQWLLAGHRPSHYPQVRTYRGKIDGRYAKATRLAVKRAKYQLGWPKRLLDGRHAGAYFFSIIKGRQPRRLYWVAIAAKRAAHPVPPPASTCATRMLNAGRSQLGVTESPWGSNRGARVGVYQSVTGAYGAAWCVSFYQWELVQAHQGPIADRTAGVFYLYHWAQARGWVHSTPRPGAGVAFLANPGHMGLVERVTTNGYYTLEGNHNNGVYRVFRRFGELQPVYVWLPCLS